MGNQNLQCDWFATNGGKRGERKEREEKKIELSFR